MSFFLPLSGRLVRASVALFFSAACALTANAAEPKKSKAKARSAPTATASSEFAAWVEPNFPFFSSVLDARKAGAGLPPDNLAPRGIILNLGHDCWACFDPDLLRVSAIWRGQGVAPKALAPGSYPDMGRKTPGGQESLPTPEGAVWLASGIYPGWQTTAEFSLTDPRSPAPSPEEVGRGPLPETMGRFEAVRLVGNSAVLDYTVSGVRVSEWLTASFDGAQPTISRHFTVAPSSQDLTLVLGVAAPDTTLAVSTGTLGQKNAVWTVRLPAHNAPRALTVAIAPQASSSASRLVALHRAAPDTAPARRWPQETTTAVKLSAAKDAYVVDHIALPAKNPWRRALRASDVQFLTDGTGVIITLDGDVWLARGLHDASGNVRWSRFASGLHEPMSVAIRDEEIFAFDKNGIWRLRDTDGNGEADVHELFSNAFAQTADYREFPSQVRLAPGGEFVIAKGGQQATTLGKHNGSVLRISADGRRSTVLGYGFRQPNIGVNVRTGLVTSSDQQGQYIPSTPLHIVRDRQFYGFLAPFLPKEKYPAPIAEPLTWIPHAVNTSALSQAWLFGARMGPLNDALVHIGFNQPELFRVLLNERGSRLQASVVSVTRAFEFTPLNGSVNPADGQLYIAGFQVIGWGNVLDTGSGLGRVRYTGAPVTLPREIVPMENGVLLRFDVALDPKAARDPASYSLQSWGYQRTYKYGSPQFTADGTPGQDSLVPSSAYLSRDGRSVFVGVPGLKPVQQLRIGWSLAIADGRRFDDNAYTTPYELAKFEPAAEGFDHLTVDLTPRAAVAQAAGLVSLDEGRRLALLFACTACHAAEFSTTLARSGPPWKGLSGSQRAVFIAGKSANVTADEAYLRESILDPTAKIAAGFEKGEYAMPSYAGVLNDSQIESLILFIKSLQ